MGITTSFILGLLFGALIAAVAFVVTRKQERRHQMGLAAAQAWARESGQFTDADTFGQRCGLVYLSTLKALRASSVPQSTSDETSREPLPPAARRPRLQEDIYRTHPPGESGEAP